VDRLHRGREARHHAETREAHPRDEVVDKVVDKVVGELVGELVDEVVDEVINIV
jgi:hypothetical protein